MDLDERYKLTENPYDYILDYVLRHVWTNQVGMITKDSDGYTVQTQPTIKYKETQPDETVKDKDMPILQDVPICHLGGGGVVLTFPIHKGDEVLLNHAARPIDNWWTNGGSQPQIDQRIHSMSDAIAVPGLWSQPRKIQNVSTASVQLRTTGGTSTRDASGKTTFTPHAIFDLKPDGSFTLNSVKPMTTNVPQHNYTGDVTITGTLRATEVIATGNNITLGTHLHSDVLPGGGNTGPPVSGTMRSTMVACWAIATLLALDIVLRVTHAIP
jgi:hypothetical protein